MAAVFAGAAGLVGMLSGRHGCLRSLAQFRSGAGGGQPETNQGVTPSGSGSGCVIFVRPGAPCGSGREVAVVLLWRSLVPVTAFSFNLSVGRRGR